jgi:hypothetical protein
MAEIVIRQPAVPSVLSDIATTVAEAAATITEIAVSVAAVAATIAETAAAVADNVTAIDAAKAANAAIARISGVQADARRILAENGYGARQIEQVADTVFGFTR